MLRAPESAEVRRSLVTLTRAVLVVKWAESRLEGFIEVIGLEMWCGVGRRRCVRGFWRGTRGWR